MLDSITASSATALGVTTRAARVESLSGAAPAAATAATAGAGTVSFDSVLGQVASDAIGALKAGEAASISGIQGKATAQQVVEAVMSAEQSLQMAIAVRDKVVQAYQEVTRMAI